jgi:hypothetical protein
MIKIINDKWKHYKDKSVHRFMEIHYYVSGNEWIRQDDERRIKHVIDICQTLDSYLLMRHDTYCIPMCDEEADVTYYCLKIHSLYKPITDLTA